MNFLKESFWIVMIFAMLFLLNGLIFRAMKKANKDIADIKYVTNEHQKALINHAEVIRQLLPKEVKK
jgi:hypothetical protein